MKARLGCRGVRSMRCAVEKIPVWIEVTCGGSRVIVEISKSSFFSRSKRGEFRGAIIGMTGPEVYVGPWTLSENT